MDELSAELNPGFAEEVHSKKYCLIRFHLQGSAGKL